MTLILTPLVRRCAAVRLLTIKRATCADMAAALSWLPRLTTQVCPLTECGSKQQDGNIRSVPMSAFAQ
jgi:hypothetical protein